MRSAGWTIARYGAVGLLFVVAGCGAAWPFLDGAGRRGVFLAGAVAWGVQVIAFGALVKARDRVERFLLVWGGGTLVRLALVLLAGLLVAKVALFPPAPTLMALAAFFFGLLLLEPVFFGSGTTNDEHQRGT